MIRIINGKRYNTETATLVAHVGSRAQSRSDFNYHDTNLYVTKDGAWFLAGDGGPRSMWAHDTGNGIGWGDGIRPLSRLEALEELEAHNHTEAIEQHFADLVADA